MLGGLFCQSSESRLRARCAARVAPGRARRLGLTSPTPLFPLVAPRPIPFAAAVELEKSRLYQSKSFFGAMFDGVELDRTLEELPGRFCAFTNKRVIIADSSHKSNVQQTDTKAAQDGPLYTYALTSAVEPFCLIFRLQCIVLLERDWGGCLHRQTPGTFTQVINTT